MLTRFFRSPRKNLGSFGEEQAVVYLKKNGYTICARNFKTRFGEIDLVGRDGSTLCFIEVKARMSLRSGFPEESVTPNKQWRLTRLAWAYLKQFRLEDVPVRFDVISILFGQNGEIDRMRLIKGAFDAV